jgi:hypothetical protein
MIIFSSEIRKRNNFYMRGNWRTVTVHGRMEQSSIAKIQNRGSKILLKENKEGATGPEQHCS